MNFISKKLLLTLSLCLLSNSLYGAAAERAEVTGNAEQQKGGNEEQKQAAKKIDLRETEVKEFEAALDLPLAEIEELEAKSLLDYFLDVKARAEARLSDAINFKTNAKALLNAATNKLDNAYHLLLSIRGPLYDARNRLHWATDPNLNNNSKNENDRKPEKQLSIDAYNQAKAEFDKLYPKYSRAVVAAEDELRNVRLRIDQADPVIFASTAEIARVEKEIQSAAVDLKNAEDKVQNIIEIMSKDEAKIALARIQQRKNEERRQEAIKQELRKRQSIEDIQNEAIRQLEIEREVKRQNNPEEKRKAIIRQYERENEVRRQKKREEERAKSNDLPRQTMEEMVKKREALLKLGSVVSTMGSFLEEELPAGS